ncbi:hypothetical protein K504DRAFT_499006 [Pleomassaria siparia CBS 279.74]|uniref:Uncharacterized protein n=1 Tax=Pleomassaria siparia CBS 279.74 TaxID=1314801 RepID=A0A6G1KPC7_9PLEO|nr:hypothetical protein K504DRAFT_499006 [Pleomassaria siparia CBS 279.74]
MSLGAAATAIGGAYKMGEFLYKAKHLRDVGPSNAVYVRLINRVRFDLDEVKRLLTVPDVKEALKANPPKAKWVYGAMRDVRGALENISPHTERVGGDIENGKRVGIRHRVFWLLSEKEKLENREKELSTAHGSLMEVIGFLTALEPVNSKGQHAHDKSHGEGREAHGTHDARNTKIDVDVRHSGPERVEERDVWIERQDGAPRRIVEEHKTIIEEHRGPRHFDEREVRFEHEHRGPRHLEEREVRIEHDRHGKHGEKDFKFVKHHDHRGPHHSHNTEVRFEREPRGPRHVDEREVYYQDERDVRHIERHIDVDERGHPVRYDERETYVDQHDPRYEAQFDGGRHGGHVDERELHIERDPRDPRHVEARYTERGPSHYEEKRYEERRFPNGGAPLGRRPESFEDRVPERETWMESAAHHNAHARNGAYEVAPRRTYGDPGFGDEEILNPQPVPYGREIWIEEKEDFTHDKYGNKLPEKVQNTWYPSYPKSRV